MLNFKIALQSVRWDNSYTHTLLFDTREEQQSYFDIPNIFTNSPAVNFALGSLYLTQVSFISPNPFVDVLNYNYAIIQDNTPNARYPYLYYFINKIEHLSGGQVRLWMEIDVMQTYFVDCIFQECIINRCHLQRKLEGQSIFYNSPSSPWLKTENQESLPKRLKKREALSFYIDTSPTTVFETYVREKGIKWIVFICADTEKLSSIPQPFKVKGISSGYKVLWAPFYENDTHNDAVYPLFWIKDNGVFYAINMWKTFQEVQSLGADAAAYAKITPLCPLDAGIGIKAQRYDINVETGTPGNPNPNGDAIVIENYKTTNGDFYTKETGTNVAYAYLNSQKQIPAQVQVKLPYKIDTTNPFIFDNIPKTLSPIYKECKIVDYAGNSWDIDMQKLNKDTFTLSAIELLSADSTLTAIRIKDMAGSTYTNGLQDTYTGLINNSNNQLPLSFNALDTFLAQNKNFSLLQQAQRDYNEELNNINIKARNRRAFVDGVGNFISGVLNPAQAAQSAANIVTGVAGAAVSDIADYQRTQAQNDLNRLQETATLDNMRAAPYSVKNAQGSVLFNLIAGKSFDYFIEYWEPLDAAKNEQVAYFKRNGYVYMQAGNIHEVARLRQRYNYVQAEIENIHMITPLSNEVRNIIRNIFKAGITFWNPNKHPFDYIPTNPERYN